MSQLCRFYYEDSHRKAPRRECRLVGRNPASARWDEKLCKSCPVPHILESNPCANLALEAEVKSRFGILRRISVYAVCSAKMEEIRDPKSCRQGCSQFESL